MEARHDVAIGRSVRDRLRTIETAAAKLLRQAERGWLPPRDALPGFVGTVRGLRDGFGRWLTVDDTRADRAAFRHGLARVQDQNRIGRHRYGYYPHQRFTAQRLVVDTGLNAFGWSLERAREYMAATTMESTEQIRTETLRYATDMPGQALGYRLGYLKLWELRRRATDALGTGFDVRDFHERILVPGALPLTAVAENIARYAQGTEGSTTCER